MDKLLTYPGKSDKGVHTFLINSEKNYLVKTAAEYHPTIASYISAAKPIPGITQILLTALGASEYWGINSNGDYFGEDQLAHEGDDYGFKTFETYAKLYKHHVNKDPSASYGNVLLSIYNPIYHRVELIVGVRHDTGYDIVEQIENGNYPVFSMGCKIPFDICSICGNKAPNRKHYCEHLKYMLGQIDPNTGKQVYAINIRPKFFDISYVLVPADKTAYMLKKVAYAVSPGFIEGSASLAEKRATTMKRSEMDKEVPANQPPSSVDLLTTEQARQAAKTILEVRRREQPIPPQVLDHMSAAASLKEIVSTMLSCLVVPNPQEFQRLVFTSMGRTEEANKLDRIGAVFDPTKPPQMPPDVAEVDTHPGYIHPGVLRLLEPYLESRSYSAPLVHKRMSLMVKQAAPVNLPPRYVDTRQNEGSSSVLPAMGVAAALYAALLVANKEHRRKILAQITSLAVKHPSVAVGLGIGAVGGVAVLKRGIENTPRNRGSFTPDSSLYPDSIDLYDRIERTSAKPYLKVSSDRSSSAERLLAGMPMAFMVSPASQWLGFTNPSEEEWAINKVAQDLSSILSGPANNAATLIGAGNVRLPYTDLLKMAGVFEESTPRNSESASISDYVSGTSEKCAQHGILDEEIIALGKELTKLRC